MAFTLLVQQGRLVEGGAMRADEPETGSNQWNNRWTTEDGAVFYTDNDDDDPNAASLMNNTDWRRTPVRPRIPQ